MVGWMLVWSDQTELSMPRCATPGPAIPTQVVLICSDAVPWFHASPPLGSLKHDFPHEAFPLDSQKLSLPNSTSDGVRFGAPVTMSRSFTSTGAAGQLLSR